MKTIEQQTITQFIEAHGITLATTRIPARSDGLGDSWEKTARHFLCTLRRGGNGTGKGPQVAEMSICFSQGSAHTKPPTVEDVLDCLAQDAAGIENSRSFDDWCGEYGYDSDSRKAEKTYRACKEQHEQLRRFICSPASFNELLFNTERL